MTFIDRATHRIYQDDQFVVAYPKARPQRPGIADRCELLIFVLRREPRVFIGGGEFGFDGLAREADSVEIEALAERFNLAELREVLAAGAKTPSPNEAR